MKEALVSSIKYIKVLMRQQTYQNIPRRFLNILEHSCM